MIVCLGTVALTGWIVLAFVVDPVGRPSDVWALIGIAAVQMLLAGAATWVITRKESESPPRSPPRSLHVALAFAVAFRVVMLAAGLGPNVGLEGLVQDLASDSVTFDNHLLYDDDVWRFLWDGRIQQLGFDPYRTSPTSIEALADDGDPVAETLLEDDRWYEIHQRIGYPDHPSVYPPLMQFALRGLTALAPGSVLTIKLSAVLADLVVCWLLVLLLRRVARPPGLVVLYAWHPLPIKEIAGSAHVESWLVVLMVAAVLALAAGRARSAVLAWTAAVLTKLSPIVLVGIFAARVRWRNAWPAILFAAIVVWPFASSLGPWLESMRSFTSSWRFNAGFWRLVGGVADRLGAVKPAVWADGAARLAVVAAVIVSTVVAWRSRRNGAQDRARVLVLAVFGVLAVVVLTAPTVNPWYALWVLPFAVAAGRWPFVIFGVLLFFSYLTYTVQRELAWWLWLEHGGYVVLLGIERFFALRNRRISRTV